MDFVHPEDTLDILAIVASSSARADVEFVVRYRTKEGIYRNVQWWPALSEEGFLYLSSCDVTEVQRESSRSAEIEDVSGVCSWEVDLETNEVFWSSGTKRLIGWTEDRQPKLEEALGLYPEDSLSVLQPVFARLVESGTPYSIEVTHLRVDGGSFLARATGAAELRRGRVVRAYGTFEDITQRRRDEQETLSRERELRAAAEAAFDAERKAQQRQAWAARHDSLTGLGNRQFLEELLAESDGESYLVLAIDLDDFKVINDSFGHEAGDFVLRRTAKRMQDASTGSHDRSFRIGGDEFVMLVNQRHMTQTPAAYCDWLLDQLLESAIYQGVELSVRASIGFAETDCNVPLAQALRNADVALYEAKARGRNQALAYADWIGAAHMEKLALANDLRVAVQKCEIGIALQPQVHAASRKLCGCEVLARWNHPSRGTISPGVFVPLADELNLLSRLDQIVLDKALQARSELSRRGLILPKTAVNVSAKRLASPGLAEEIFSRKDLPEDGLAFEILETAFLDTIGDDVGDTLNALRAQGIRIEVDDFGTGHASFASVLALQPDVLKFDRIFASGIESDGGKRDMMEGLIKIARHVGAETLVEGVETEAQATALVELGVDYLQGYAIGHPMSIDMLLEWAGANGAIHTSKIA